MKDFHIQGVYSVFITIFSFNFGYIKIGRLQLSALSGTGSSRVIKEMVEVRMIMKKKKYN